MECFACDNIRALPLIDHAPISKFSTKTKYQHLLGTIKLQFNMRINLCSCLFFSIIVTIKSILKKNDVIIAPPPHPLRSVTPSSPSPWNLETPPPP